MRTHLLAICGMLLCSLPATAHAQLVTTVVNRDGVSLPCVTVGPLAPIAQDYCVRRTLAQGFVLKSELGTTGLTIGTTGDEDGVITAVAAGSPAAKTGLAVGDRPLAVDGVPVRRTPASIAEQRAFGHRDEPVQLTLRRGAATLQRTFKRGPAPEPSGAPKSPNFLVGVHPIMNWEGVFVPCMGAGLLGPAVIAACQSHYRGDGFVVVSALGKSGLSFDQARTDAAIVSAVDPGSPAAAADIQSGDEVTAIDGRPLTTSLGTAATALLFGKANALRRVTVDRQGRKITADVTLAAAK